MVLTAGVLLSIPPPVLAADNAALGGIKGIDNGTLIGGDGTGEARLTLFSTDLALVKQARDLSGIVLPDGTDVSSGQEIPSHLSTSPPSLREPASSMPSS